MRVRRYAIRPSLYRSDPGVPFDKSGAPAGPPRPQPGAFKTLVEYQRTFRHYIGRRTYVVFALAGLTALMECFGISLLLPLLAATDPSGRAHLPDDGLMEVVEGMLAALGIGNSVPGILGFIALIFVLKGAIKYTKEAYGGWLQARLVRELRAKLFDLYSRMDYRHYVQRDTGHFINVLLGQIKHFYIAFGAYTNFLSTFVTALAYLAVAFMVTWRFALMVAVVGTLIPFSMASLTRRVRALSRQQAKESGKLSKLVIQVLHAFKYLVSTNQIPQMRRGIMKSIHTLTENTYRTKRIEAIAGSIQEPISVVLIIAVITVQVAVLKQPMAPIFVSIILLHRGMRYALSLQSQWQQVMSNTGAVEMVIHEFDEIRANQEQRPKDGTKLVLSNAVEFDRVSFAYRAGEPVLRELSVSIPAKTTVAFVGESGAGKSTLVDMLTLMLRPDTGDIRIDGVSARDVDVATWRSQIGYVSQETVVFDDTVAANISLFADKSQAGQPVMPETRTAAEKAYAAKFIDEMPAGYHTVVGDRGIRLSGGQRQRLFIARELFKQPKILILDEATSALDSESERQIQQSIDELKGSLTVVIIAHRLSTVKNADFIYVLDRGRIVETGTYDELAGSEASRFRRMIDMQRL